MKTKKTMVGLLFGGRSAEHEISLISASSIYNNIDKKKFEIRSIYINRNGEWKVVSSPLLPASFLSKGRSFSFLPWGKNSLPLSVRADIYFPALHGPYGEDGTIQGLLEMADVPYVGAPVLASAIAMDKALTKTILKAMNIPVVHHLIILEQEWINDRKALLAKIIKEFRLPFFVKPASLGSSIGISKVKKEGDVPAALERAFGYDQKILIEEGIRGRELECSVLGNDRPRASLPGEVIPFREFYDYRDKYIEGKTRFGIPAELPASRVKEIQRLSLKAFKAIHCAGMARIDFLQDEKTKRIYVNEINTIPGFTEISMYPKLWEASGLSFPQLVDELVELGFERHRKKKRSTENIR